MRFSGSKHTVRFLWIVDGTIVKHRENFGGNSLWPPRAKIKPSECASAVFTVKRGPDDFLSFQRSQHAEAAQEEQHPPPARPRWALGSGRRNGRLLRGSSGVSEPPPPSPGQIQEEELPASHPHPPPYPRHRFREHRLPAGLDPSSCSSSARDPGVRSRSLGGPPSSARV